MQELVKRILRKGSPETINKDKKALLKGLQ